MATTSEVKAGLDEIANTIRSCRQRYVASKARIQAAFDELDGIPVRFSGVLATINGYTGASVFEELAEDEKAKLTTEFQALKAEVAALIATTEFGS